MERLRFVALDVEFERILVHIGPLNEELDHSRLLGREQLVPDRGEVGQQGRRPGPALDKS